MSPIKRNRVPNALRSLIIKQFNDGVKIKCISDSLELNYETVRTVIKRYKNFGDQVLPKGHRKPKLLPIHIERLKSLIEEDCQRTLVDLADRIESEFEIKVCKSTINNYLNGLNFSVKRISPIPIRRNCDSTITIRKDYAAKFMNLNPYRVLFIDECGVAVHSRYNYGRSEKGKRANLNVQSIRGKNFSVCAAISMENLEFYQTQEKPYNADDFIDYLKQLLEFFPNGSIEKYTLIMDNVRFHHDNRVEEIVRGYNHEVLFLPPYSPFLNPIENMFNQLKFYIKRLRPADGNAVFSAIENASQCISSDDCKNYWTNMMKYVSLSLQGIAIDN